MAGVVVGAAGAVAVGVVVVVVVAVGVVVVVAVGVGVEFGAAIPSGSQIAINALAAPTIAF